MKQMNFAGKATVLTVFLTMCILGGAVFLAASREPDNHSYIIHGEADAEDNVLWAKGLEVQSYLCSFDKVGEAFVLVERSDNGTSIVSVLIVMEEEMSDSEKEELSAAVSQCFGDEGTAPQITMIYEDAEG